MTRTVWLGADTLDYPEGGGHLWVYLNWALGLRALGCKVVWLEPVEEAWSADAVGQRLASLRQRLSPYGLADSIAVCPKESKPAPVQGAEGSVDLATARDADLFLNLACHAFGDFLGHFRRTAVVDLDPGLLQMWVREGLVRLPGYDTYFTIAEGMNGAPARDGALWTYTPPCVALDWWPVHRAPAGAPFTTVSLWTSDSRFTDGQEWYPNQKRDGFLPYLDLPRQTGQRLELALCLAADEDDDRSALEARGWNVVQAFDVASTPWEYRRYIQNSRGEFSCSKPSSVRFQKAWVSDRTLCYLASGKPCVVEDTGPSRFLPNSAGLFRFRTREEAARSLDAVADDYEHQCRLARELAEEWFDANKVLAGVLAKALA